MTMSYYDHLSAGIVAAAGNGGLLVYFAAIATNWPCKVNGQFSVC